MYCNQPTNRGFSPSFFILHILYRLQERSRCWNALATCCLTLAWLDSPSNWIGRCVPPPARKLANGPGFLLFCVCEPRFCWVLIAVAFRCCFLFCFSLSNRQQVVGSIRTFVALLGFGAFLVISASVWEFLCCVHCWNVLTSPCFAAFVYSISVFLCVFVVYAAFVYSISVCLCEGAGTCWRRFE